ncbi:hypothetical protein EC991_001542 [Linnemannia zychae]|nr:hypothetical protein EC991_001542 [Linnemannia zychae]
MHVRKQSHSFFQAAIWSPAASNLLCVLLALLTHVVTALTPIATHGMAYATIEESIFIIQGGGEYQNATSTVVTNQLFTVNLTLLSWDATNPPWEAITIPSGFTSMTTMWHSISLSRDLQTLTFWDSSTGGSVVSYERDSGKWSISNSPEALQNAGEDIKAVTDPNTGHIYLPLGYYGYNMLICEPEPLTPSGLVANTTLQLPSSTLPVASAGRFNFGVMPEAVRLNATGYSFIWSSSRQSLLLFGGRLGNGGSAEEPYFHEFNPNSAAWNVFETAGGPPRLIDSCMVEAYNGTKIIIFGGHQVDGFSIGDIYIYDFPTKAWNKGPSIDSLRSSHACSVAGDNLLVWGGIRKLGLLPEIYAKVDGPMQIYNIYKNQWVQTYERANHYNPSLVAPPPPATLTPPETDATKKNKTSEAVVVAVPLAIVLVLLVVGLIYIYRRKPEFFRRPIPWDKHDDHFDSPGGPGNQLVISSDSPISISSTSGTTTTTTFAASIEFNSTT